MSERERALSAEIEKYFRSTLEKTLTRVKLLKHEANKSTSRYFPGGNMVESAMPITLLSFYII